MPLHPTIKEMVKVTKDAKNLPISKIPLEEVRKSPMRMKRLMGDPIPLAKVVSHIIPTDYGNLLMKFYYPDENKPLPLLFYFHPGGFVKEILRRMIPSTAALLRAADALLLLSTIL